MQRVGFKSEVFIIGGGPAGLAAGIAARTAGFSVALADCAKPPIDKACGEGIMPDGLAALRALGVEIPAEFGFRFRGIKFVSGARAVNSDFPDGTGVGLRRTILHQFLLDKAAELGIEMHWGGHVVGSAEGKIMLGGRTVESKWLIAADGENSAIRCWAGLDQGQTSRRRFGFRRHYQIAPWSEFVEIFWSDHAQMYITPIAHDRICAALISSDQHLRFSEGLQLFPELEARLGDAAPVTHEQGAVSPTRKLRAVFKDNLALLGDASGSVDAITGDGLSLVFQQAAALTGAMCNGDLEIYQRRHREIGQLPRFMAEMMLAMDGRPRFRKRVFGALAADPALFDRMLGLHTGSISPFSFGVRNAASLGWHLLTANTSETL